MLSRLSSATVSSFGWPSAHSRRALCHSSGEGYDGKPVEGLVRRNETRDSRARTASSATPDPWMARCPGGVIVSFGEGDGTRTAPPDRQGEKVPPRGCETLVFLNCYGFPGPWASPVEAG